MSDAGTPDPNEAEKPAPPVASPPVATPVATPVANAPLAAQPPFSIADWWQALGKGRQIVVIAGGVFFVASMLPWYRAKFEILGIKQSTSINAWTSEAWSTLSILTMLATVAMAAIINLKSLAANRSILAIGQLAGAGLCALCTLAFMLRIGSRSFGAEGVSASAGVSFGAILGLLAAIAMAGGAFLGFQADGSAAKRV